MMDSGHSTVSYTLISSPERSWDIPNVDPYKEAALQAIEQVAPPLSPAYLPDPIELDEHVPVYVLEPEYPKYLEPPADDMVAEDQPYAEDAVPTALFSGYIADSDLEEDPEEEENADYANEPEEEDQKRKTIRRKILRKRSLMIILRRARISIRPQTPMPPLSEARVAELLTMPTPLPSLLTPMSSLVPQIPSPPFPVPSPPPVPSSPLPLPVPVKTHAPEQDAIAALLMLPSITRRSEVGESSAAAAFAATRPPRDLCGFVDTTQAEASITRRHARTLYDIERMMMTTVELVNLRVNYEAQTLQRDGEEFHSQLRDAQRNRADIRDEIVALRDRETRMTEMEDQFQDARDRAVSHMICTQALKARAQIDTMEDAVMSDQAMQRNSTKGDGSHSSRGGPIRPVQSVRACSNFDFMKCQPLNFKGTKGLVGLSCWFKKIESVFHISGCAVENQVKFVTSTMLDAALTWWNGHVRTLGHDVAYAMTWGTLKKKLTDKYCPKGEIKKLEIELWNLKVRGNDVAAYAQRFQELALMCTKFLADETEKVDKYIIPENINGNVMSARPKTLDNAIKLSNDLMDQKLRTYAEMQNDNKGKADDSSRNN
uniref:Reverse transcriptase domain-containing protein n=1 Tax=Tanacetum cinerariifolium TaxID=118510 RepID=A0A699H1L5_TANCI|nr:reverse transcriptase domain-containing protein [Tanacetum cinerariifolium]GEW97744.1 reverse transcriptase domain-containing protein [Tanacetum cinerariifolium]